MHIHVEMKRNLATSTCVLCALLAISIQFAGNCALILPILMFNTSSIRIRNDMIYEYIIYVLFMTESINSHENNCQW